MWPFCLGLIKHLGQDGAYMVISYTVDPQFYRFWWNSLGTVLLISLCGIFIQIMTYHYHTAWTWDLPMTISYLQAEEVPHK